MKKLFLFLLISTLYLTGNQITARAGNCAIIDTWEVTSPTDPLYPYGYVTGTYSGTNILDGDLFYENQILYAYSSNDGSIFIYDLAPGNYEFVYCGGSITFTVDPIACDVSIANIAATDVSGAGCTPNGSIDLSVTSSNVGYPYYYNLTELNTGVEYTGQDDGYGLISITGLPAGTYTLFVSQDMDVLNSSCFASDLVIINEPACDMEITASQITDATSQNATDGVIELSISGSSCYIGPPGPPIYNVTATIGGSPAGALMYNPNTQYWEITGLAPGTYTITADNGGQTCFITGEYTVSFDGACNLPSPVIVASNTTICNGSPAILEMPYGMDSYQWLFNGSYYIPGALTGNDHEYWAYLEGNYSCIVTLNGCTAVSNSVFVSAPLSPPINFPDTVYSCDNSVTLIVPGDFNYQFWSSADAGLMDTTETFTINTDGWYGLAAGVSSLTCGVVDTFYVSLGNSVPPVSINLIGSNPFCTGTTVTLESSAPDGNVWSTGETTPSITVGAAGVYTVEISNNMGCTASDTLILDEINCVPNTKLTGSACGNMLFVKTSAVPCIAVPGATKYEFEFSHNNIVYATKFNTAPYVLLHSVSPAINWGTTWDIRVRVYIGQQMGTYGDVCTIGVIPEPTQNGLPKTRIRNEDCGQGWYTIAGGHNRIVALAMSGAITYEFEFTDIQTNTVVAVASRPNPVLFFNTMNPTLPVPAQYSVRVRYKMAGGGPWADWGPSCNIGIGSYNRLADNNTEENVSMDTYFEITAMPNPYSDITTLMINSSENESVYVQVYDLTGNLVQDVKVNTNEAIIFGTELSQGVYFLKARTDSGYQTTTRLVKTH